MIWAFLEPFVADSGEDVLSHLSFTREDKATRMCRRAHVKAKFTGRSHRSPPADELDELSPTATFPAQRWVTAG